MRALHKSQCGQHPQSPRGWELHAIRNRGGVHTCELQAPDGSMVTEPLAECAARAPTREWLNPAEEIDHMVTLSDFLAKRKQHRAGEVR